MGDCRCVESQAGDCCKAGGMVSAGSGGRPPGGLIHLSVCILYFFLSVTVSFGASVCINAFVKAFMTI